MLRRGGGGVAMGHFKVKDKANTFEYHIHEKFVVCKTMVSQISSKNDSLKNQPNPKAVMIYQSAQ